MIKDGNLQIPVKWFKHFVYFLLEAGIVLSIVIFGINFFSGLPSSELKPFGAYDPMSVANTFMVFVTFIVVIGTVAITLVGIYFTRWWGREKKQVLAENWSDMIETVKEDGNLMKQLKEDLLNDSLEEMMKEHVYEHKKEILENVKSEMVNIEERILAKIKSAKSEEIVSAHVGGEGILLQGGGDQDE